MKLIGNDMSTLTNWLLVVAYGISCVAGGILFVEYDVLDQNFAIVASGLAFVLTAQFHVIVNRGRERKQLGREITYLRKANTIISEEVERLGDHLTEFKEETSEKSDHQTRQLVSEVRVLESLLKQMAENWQKKARTAALEALEDKLAAERGTSARAVEIGGPANKLIDSLHGALDGAERDKALRDAEGEGESHFVDKMSEKELLSVIRGSLEENRVDLYLQPIVTLPQRKVMFYEALSRLRSDQGDLIMPAHYLKVAEPAGLMSIIDNLLLFRCVQMVRRLTEVNKNVSVICNISCNSLMDREFFPQFLEFISYNRDLTSHLIFEFGQESVESTDAVVRSNLDRLGDIGFRFSMDKVTALDLDLPDLRQRNVRFIKVPVDALISATEKSDGVIHPSDFKELLSRFGIDLIAERVENEKQAIEVIDVDVELGQGFLFGRPAPLEEVEARIGASETRGVTEDDPKWKPIAYLEQHRQVVGG